jgi:hypothetical protein
MWGCLPWCLEWFPLPSKGADVMEKAFATSPKCVGGMKIMKRCEKGVLLNIASSSARLKKHHGGVLPPQFNFAIHTNLTTTYALDQINRNNLHHYNPI